MKFGNMESAAAATRPTEGGEDDSCHRRRDQEPLLVSFNIARQQEGREKKGPTAGARGRRPCSPRINLGGLSNTDDPGHRLGSILL